MHISNEALTFLENLSRRPGMYMGTSEVKRVESYLEGFWAGCAVGGLVVPDEIHVAVAKSRGWKSSAYGIVPSMREKSLTNEEILAELIAVAMDSVRRVITNSTAE